MIPAGGTLPLVKICGVRTESDLTVCAACDVNAVGLVFAPGSPRQLSPAEAIALYAGMPSTLEVPTRGEMRDALELAASLLRMHTSASAESILEYVSLGEADADVLPFAEAEAVAGDFDLREYVEGLLQPPRGEEVNRSSNVDLLGRLGTAESTASIMSGLNDTVTVWVFRKPFLASLGEAVGAAEDLGAWKLLCKAWFMERVYQFVPQSMPSVYGLDGGSHSTLSGRRAQQISAHEAMRSGSLGGHDRNEGRTERAAATVRAWNRAIVGKGVRSTWDGGEVPDRLGLPSSLDTPWKPGRKRRWTATGIKPPRVSFLRSQAPIAEWGGSVGGAVHLAMGGEAQTWEREWVAAQVCAAIASTYLQPLTDSEFAERVVDGEAAMRVLDIGAELREKLASGIEEGEYLTITSSVSRRRVAEKVRAISITISSTGSRRDVSSLRGLNLRGHLLSDVLDVASILIRDEVAWGLQAATGSVAEHPPYFTADTPNAYYDPGTNAVTIMPAILQSPFASRRWDDRSLRASIGTIVSHELAHSVDRYGLLFDEYGGCTPMLAGDDEWEAYLQSLEPIRLAYWRRTSLGNLHNGDKTLDENIADVLGSRLAEDTWCASDPEDCSSPAGILGFWSTYAQMWCAATDRANEAKMIATDKHAIPEMRVQLPAQASLRFSDITGCSRIPLW